ncbi:hypothetical protein [Aneurinibacillus migulanus]|uniref:hypothetical protein n=1 Tax=Aneurinibacillus migulanus TaxID=47500 RepID=UPI00069C1FF4|nr:hypothetical protein [Aneurinibacillus migulanus]MED0896451.1 hypothetical protein [Aneurinibacillus migulanus]MED1618203.1 hypothetical protein [Aneurinibacillus migulanus]GED15401.1 hypothetical protein AMI01nite_33920 [Aneurinibacillus migulanus]
MKDIIKYISLDISKESIAVAIADSGREAPRFYGMIPNTPEAIRKRVDHVGKNAQLEICYEAGPTGYGVYRCGSFPHSGTPGRSRKDRS